MPRRTHVIVAVVLIAFIVFPFAMATSAQQSESQALDLTNAVSAELNPVEQMPLPVLPANVTTCAGLLSHVAKGGFTDPELVLTDAQMFAGSPGNRVCVFWDRLWRVYGVYPLNHRSLDEFRETKSAILPRMEEAGIDVCRIAYFQPVGRGATNQNLWHDVGRRCEAEIVAHGSRSERRLDEVRVSLAAAQARTEELLGWPLSWPLRIHVYDNKDDYVEGIRVDAGANVPEYKAKQSAGMAITQPDRITAIALDISGFPTQDDMTELVAHEYHHIAQNAVLGASSTLPYFVKEGGAEYFASLVVGADQRGLRILFQKAVDDERAKKAKPLSMLIMDFGAVSPEAYSRGYAAMRFLVARWGEEAFLQLYMDNIDGTANQYLLNMTRVTNMTLDEFDRELNAWLRSFPSDYRSPTPIPTAPPRPGSTPRPGTTPPPQFSPPPIPSVPF